MRRPLLYLSLVAVACSTAGCMMASSPAGPGCVSNSDCTASQICFPEGCGDPGKNLAIEVVPSPTVGHYAQDFWVDELSAQLDLKLFPPLSIDGQVSIGLATPQVYTRGLSLTAEGKSEIIPGVTRVYSSTFSVLDRGSYSMPVGAGSYTLTATPQETSIPSLAQQVVLDPRLAPFPAQNLAFPSDSEVTVISGRLLRVAADNSPVTQAQMDLLVRDPLTKRSLSQRTPASSGYSGSRGDFTLYVDQSADSLDPIEIVAQPRDGTAFVPTKVFTLHRPFPDPLVLEMGDWGSPVPGLTGTVVDAKGSPVKGARLYMEGTVAGGGTWRSRPVETDAQGQFQVDLLPPSGNGMLLVAVPPPSATAGILQAKVTLKRPAGGTASLVPTTFSCPSRIPLRGTVVTPDGALAPDVKVLAHPIDPVDGLLMPLDPVEVFTDTSGQFTLWVDPAHWRIDFLPGGGLPRRTRLVLVHRNALPGMTPSAVDLNVTELFRGRKVSGVVTEQQSALQTNQKRVPNASIRFFRVTTVGGEPSAVLLGQTLADDSGAYSVMLPSP